MSEIQMFYINDLKVGKKNHNIAEIIAQNNEYWENCHDIIQWVFPTKTLSAYNVNSPTLSDKDIRYIQNNKVAQAFYTIAKYRFLGFLMESDMREFNHNYLRISRLLESVFLIEGIYQSAKCLKEVLRLDMNIPAKTVAIWLSKASGL